MFVFYFIPNDIKQINYAFMQIATASRRAVSKYSTIVTVPIVCALAAVLRWALSAEMAAPPPSPAGLAPRSGTLACFYHIYSWFPSVSTEHTKTSGAGPFLQRRSFPDHLQCSTGTNVSSASIVFSHRPTLWRIEILHGSIRKNRILN